MRRRISDCQYGQVATEYVVIGCLVACVSIAACLGMANSSSDLIGTLKNWLGIQSEKSTLAVANPIVNVTPPTPSPANAANLSEGLSKTGISPVDLSSTGGTGPVTLTLGDGSTMDITTVRDLTNSIETAGANGTTTILASTIEAIAKQLMAQGKISAEQGSELINLANQGHRIASVQAAIEGVLPSINSGSDYESASVNFEGRSVSFVSIVDSIAYKTDGGGNGSELAELRSLQARAQNSGAMKDPVVAAVVNSLVDQIYGIADDVENVSSYVRYEGKPGAGVVGVVAEWQTDTNGKSKSICNIGGGSDSGVKCD